MTPARRESGTRYRVPRTPRHFIRKPSVRSALDQAGAAVVLRASQGFGKSAHVTEWLQTVERPTLWHTTAAAEDASAFWADLLTTLAPIHPGADGLGPAGAADAARAVAETLRAAGPLVLVVDHLERAQSTGVAAVLVRVAQELAGLTVVVCTHPSSDPSSLAELDATVVDARSLALTRDEVADLAVSLGASLDDSTVDAVHELFWGWPAPTRSALATAVSTGESPSVDWPQLARMFGARSLTNADATEFIMRTVVLETLTPTTAGAVAGMSDAARLLRTLEEAGIVRAVDLAPAPTSAVDRADEPVYTYMPALRALVTDQTWAHVTALNAQAHRRAGRTLRAHPEQALPHAVAAGDWDTVVELVDTSWTTLIGARPELVASSISSLPADVLAGVPRLLAIRDVLLLDRHDVVTTLPVTWPAAEDTLTPAQAQDVALVATAQIIAARVGADLRYAAELARRTRRAVRDASGAVRPGLEEVLPFVLLQTGVTLLVAADVSAAHDDFVTAAEAGTGEVFEFLARNALEFAALVDAFRGHGADAERRLAAAQRLALPPAPAAAIVDDVGPLVRALLAVDRLDVAAAHAELAVLPSVGGTAHHVQSGWFFVDAVRGILHSLQEDMSAGLAAIDSALQAVPAPSEASLAGIVLSTTYARLAFAAGNPTRAATLAQQHVPVARDVVLQAHLALRSGRLLEAAELTTSGLRREHNRREQIALLLSDMEVRDALGDAAAARASLVRAAAISGTTLLHVYAVTDRDLLDRLADGLPEVAPVLAALDASGLPRFRASTADVVSLTDREQAVLAELERTSSVETVASRLVVSVNTVKSQLRSAYRKLGVSSRQAALLEAQRLGFLGGPRR